MTTALWTPDQLEEAATALRAGRLAAFPTETVYGLGARADDDAAVRRVFAAKRRPASNPLILHIEGLETARRLARLSPEAEALARAFWPGPLTLVAPVLEGAGIAPSALVGQRAAALRAPAHPLAQALIAAVGGPLVAPSANPSGAVSPVTAQDVLAGLGGRIDGVLDGGRCAVGVESTIIGCVGAPALLRPGGLAVEEIEAVLGAPLARADAALRAPGMRSRHYATEARLRLNAAAPRPGEGWLGFGPGPDWTPARNLSPGGDLAEAARNLFADLRALAGEADAIAVAPIPETGLGRALNDRLRRAAAPREPS